MGRQVGWTPFIFFIRQRGFPVAPGQEDHAFFRAWSDQITSLLAELLGECTEVALVDFPHHGNVGESAIWLGQIEVLQRLGVSVVYTCDVDRYDPATLRGKVGEGPILLQCGGNLGFLWPRHQRFRERVLEDFPHIRVIQFPQSIHFEGKDAISQVRSRFHARPDCHLILRDHPSLEFAGHHLNLPVYLAPDAGFSPGPFSRLPPASGTPLHSRVDREAPDERVPNPRSNGLRPKDWLEDDPTPAFGLDRILRGIFVDRPRLGRPLLRLYPPSWFQTNFARARVDRGVRFLSEGRVVITHRLHGHILCSLLEIRHFLSDNSNGKVRSYLDTWTHQLSTPEWRESQEEAIRRALEDIEEGPGGDGEPKPRWDWV